MRVDKGYNIGQTIDPIFPGFSCVLRIRLMKVIDKKKGIVQIEITEENLRLILQQLQGYLY
jgi:hypothetical protein